MAGRFYRFQHGGVSYTVLCESEWELPPGGGPSFVNAPPDEAQQAAAHWVAESGSPLRMSMNVLVCDIEGTRVVVDTGNGPSDESARGGMLDAMEAAGIDPASVDLVITTHCHGDHISGNTDGQGNPTFPNARYVVSEAEWNRFGPDAPEPVHRHLFDIADRYERVVPGDDIMPGIGTVPIPGHAPGMMALLIGRGDERLLHVADLFHLPYQPSHPDWSVSFDGDSEQAVQSRRTVLERAAADGGLMLAYHVAFPGLGRIEESGDAWRWRAEE